MQKQLSRRKQQMETSGGLWWDDVDLGLLDSSDLST